MTMRIRNFEKSARRTRVGEGKKSGMKFELKEVGSSEETVTHSQCVEKDEEERERKKKKGKNRNSKKVLNINSLLLICAPFFFLVLTLRYLSTIPFLHHLVSLFLLPVKKMSKKEMEEDEAG